jgi:hypothetical protein
MADPEFVADIRKRKLTIEPQSGDEVQQTVANAMATPKSLIDQVKRYIGPQ